MPSYNHVVLMGHLTRDPEIRYTPKGAAILDITLGINRTWTNEAGDKQEECSFVDCTAFMKSAETLAQYVKKGNPLLVAGRLKQESWEDKQTKQKRSKIKVIIESFQFLGTGGKDSAGRADGAGTTGNRAGKATEAAPDDDDDTNVPF